MIISYETADGGPICGKAAGGPSRLILVARMFHNHFSFFIQEDAMKNDHGKRIAECVFSFSRSKRIILLTALAGMLSAGGCGGPAVVPQSYSNYKDPNNLFSIQYPDYWDGNTGSSANAKTGWAKYSSGNAEIHVSVCPVADLIASIAQTGINPIVDLEINPSAAASKVHWLEGPQLNKDSEFKEQRALPVVTKAGKGFWSEFTSADTDSPEHGYRATVVIGKNRVQIICRCPEAEWQDLKPAFDTVIASVGP
jgi:hypothetical protein